MLEKQGSFGYKIGKKIRLMKVENNADLFWQILVREIYVLMKHFGSLETLKNKFEELFIVKMNTKKPKKNDIEKCKLFMDLNDLSISKEQLEWHHLTKYCQYSYINILESGYFLNNGINEGNVFMLDLNKNGVFFYEKKDKKITMYNEATIDEIMEFEDMPTKTYTDIMEKTKERFYEYSTKINMINDEIEKVNKIIKKTIELGREQNIIDKAKKILSDAEWDKKKQLIEYRYFYHRIELLNLIEMN